MTLGNNRLCVLILTQCHLSWKVPEPIYLLKGRIGYEYRVNIGRHSKTRGAQMHLTAVKKKIYIYSYIYSNHEKIKKEGSDDYAHGN